MAPTSPSIVEVVVKEGALVGLARFLVPEILRGAAQCNPEDVLELIVLSSLFEALSF